MRTLALLLLVAVGLSGCAGLASTIEAAGKDQASVCGAIAAPYGSVIVGRVNTPGVKLTIASGSCTIEKAPTPGGP